MEKTYSSMYVLIRKEKKSYINNLTSYLKKLHRVEQNKANVCRRKKIKKKRTEINEIKAIKQ